MVMSRAYIFHWPPIRSGNPFTAILTNNSIYDILESDLIFINIMKGVALIRGVLYR